MPGDLEEPNNRIEKGPEEKQIAEILRDLNMRRQIALAALRVIDQQTDDPRRPAAMDEYRRQLAELDKKIEEITGRPPDVVIGMKPGILSGKTPKIGG